MQRVPISAAQRHLFRRNGFIVLDHVPLIRDQSKLASLHSALERCFRGDFSRNGIYPDEWHWRQGISKPDAVREICNAYKADDDIRSVVLSEELGRIGADLMPHWGGSRVGQDDLVWKTPKQQASAAGHAPDSHGSHNFVGYHIDSTYISDQFVPSTENSVTVWIALDDADAENGVVEYVCGSHKVLGSDKGDEARQLLDIASFHAKADDDSSDAALSAAQAKDRLVGAVRRRIEEHTSAESERGDAQNMDEDSAISGEMGDLAPGSIHVPRIRAGHCIVHHQNTLHGSGPNLSGLRHRRALVVHLIQSGGASSEELRFIDAPTYIYGRYKLAGSNEVLDDFFPVTWRAE